MLPVRTISETQRGYTPAYSGGTRIRLGSMLARQTNIVKSPRRLSLEKYRALKQQESAEKVVEKLKLPPLKPVRAKESHRRDSSKEEYDLFQLEISPRPKNGPKRKKLSRSLSREELKERRIRFRQMNPNDKRRSLDNSGRLALSRFRRIGIGVKVLVKLCKSLKSYLHDDSNQNWSLMEMTLNLKHYFAKKLSFRPQDEWRNNRCSRLEVVLRVPPGLRGQEHIRVIKALLRGHKAFQDYPDHIQGQLAQVVVYQRYESRRVITRQGDPGNEFYIIASGSVLVNVREYEPEHRTRGDKYLQLIEEIDGSESESIDGDTVIETDSQSNSSDESSEESENQEHDNGVSKSELQKECSYIRSEQEKTTTPQPRSFFKTVNELKQGETFGEVALITNGYRHATIVCKTDVELLLVHKQDFDRIIKAPLESQRNKHMNYIESLELFRYFPCEYFTEQVFYYQYFKPDAVAVQDAGKSLYIVAVMTGVCKAVSKYSEAIKKGKKTPKQKTLDQIFPLHSEKLERDRTTLSNKNVSELENTASLEFNVKIKENRLLDTLDVLPPISQSRSGGDHHRARRRRSSSLTGFFDMMEKKNKTNPLVSINMTDPFWGKRMSQTESEVKSVQERFNLQTRRRSADKREQLGTAHTWKRVKALAVPATLNSKQEKPTRVAKFAQLAEFREGTVFGLETLMQRDNVPIVSLISCGAEVLFISKKFILEHANAKVFRVISDLVMTFPTEEFIDAYIQRQKKWDNFKLSLVTKT